MIGLYAVWPGCHRACGLFGVWVAGMADAASAPTPRPDCSSADDMFWWAHHFAFFKDALDAFGATVLVDERLR